MIPVNEPLFNFGKVNERPIFYRSSKFSRVVWNYYLKRIRKILGAFRKANEDERIQFMDHDGFG